jgi:hypothetical protein
MKHGIKILGLSLLAVVSMMAVTAAAAQAGEFRVGGPEGTTDTGKTFTVHGIASESVEGTIGHGILLVPVIGLEILCTGGTFSATVLLGGVVHATALYNGCIVVGNKNCVVYENKSDDEALVNGGHVVASGLGELILHKNVTTNENETYLKVAGAPFSTIYLGNVPGKKLCTLTLANEVSGSTAFLLPNALKELLNQLIHPLTTADEELLNLNAKKEGLNLGLQLFYGKELALLDGGIISDAHLTGALKDKTWGAE